MSERRWTSDEVRSLKDRVFTLGCAHDSPVNEMRLALLEVGSLLTRVLETDPGRILPTHLQEVAEGLQETDRKIALLRRKLSQIVTNRKRETIYVLIASYEDEAVIHGVDRNLQILEIMGSKLARRMKDNVPNLGIHERCEGRASNDSCPIRIYENGEWVTPQ